jgi:uncharacterized Zn finger protein (UPF0148 family)
MIQYPIGIKRFIRDGHMDGSVTPKDTAELLEWAGHTLDKACSHDICGEILFEGNDGKVYCLTVEAVIGEANPKYVEAVLSEDEEE